MKKTWTLLEDFIQKKKEAYQKPVWAGKPRDAKKGIKPRKFEAILLSALTNMTQKEISQDIGVTHGQVRIWAIAEDFKKDREGYHEEIREEFKGLAISKMNELSTEINNYLAQDIEEIMKQPLPTVSFPELSDSKHYNKELSRKLIDSLEDMVNQVGDLEDVHFLMILFYLLSEHFGAVASDNDWNMITKFLFTDIYMSVLRARDKKRTEQELKNIVYFTKLLESIEDFKRKGKCL